MPQNARYDVQPMGSRPPRGVKMEDWALANQELRAGSERADNMRRFLAFLAGQPLPDVDYYKPSPATHVMTGPVVGPLTANEAVTRRLMNTEPVTSQPTTAATQFVARGMGPRGSDERIKTLMQRILATGGR